MTVFVGQYLINRNFKAIQSEAKSYTHSMIGAQIVYYSETQQFAANIQELELKKLNYLGSPENENYSHMIVIIDKEKAAQNIGLAKKDNLKSYISIVRRRSDIYDPTVNNTNMDAPLVNGIMCESDQPTTRMPDKPKFLDTKVFLRCPTGYSEVR